MTCSDNLITYDALVEARTVEIDKEVKRERKEVKRERKEVKGERKEVKGERKEVKREQKEAKREQKEAKFAVPKKTQVRRGRVVETLPPEQLESIDMSGVYQTGFEIVSRGDNRISLKPSSSSLFVHDGLKSVLSKMK